MNDRKMKAELYRNKVSNKKYRVTRKFTSGTLEGIEHTEDTDVKWEEGQAVKNPIGGSPYIITKVEKIQDIANVAIDQSRKDYEDHDKQRKSNAKAPVDLDPYEQREFDRMTANGTSAEKALEIIVNTVEGDESQLSAGLKRLAKNKGWLNGYNNKLPSETRMDDRKARANGWKAKTVKNSYGNYNIWEDIKRGANKDQIVKNIMDRYGNIDKNQANKIYDAVKKGGPDAPADWSNWSKGPMGGS